MASSQCTTCGLIHQQGQCSQQNTTTVHDVPFPITPNYCCTCYLTTIVLFFLCVLFFSGQFIGGKESCYLELFANSVSVSNANVSTAHWRIGFVAKSPATACKISLYTLKSRLFRGEEVISSSSTPYYGKYVVFEKVVRPQVISSDVIWNFSVEIIGEVMTEVDNSYHSLMAACSDIPVKFTTDTAGKVKGTLLGNMRRCDYIYSGINCDHSA